MVAAANNGRRVVAASRAATVRPKVALGLLNYGVVIRGVGDGVFTIARVKTPQGNKWLGRKFFCGVATRWLAQTQIWFRWREGEEDWTAGERFFISYLPVRQSFGNIFRFLISHPDALVPDVRLAAACLESLSFKSCQSWKRPRPRQPCEGLPFPSPGPVHRCVSSYWP